MSPISLANRTSRNAFYRIVRTKRTVTIKFGAIGGRANVKSRTFPTRDAAVAFVDRKLVEKLAGDYVRIPATEYYTLRVAS